MSSVNWVQTRNGGWNFDTMSWVGPFVLREDVAETLANIPRFKGSTKKQWPVAAHTSVMTLTAIHLGYEPPRSFGVLRHDNHEAITGDVSSPLTRVLGPALHIIQDEIQEVLDALEGVPAGWRTQDHFAYVKALDYTAYQLERTTFLGEPVIPCDPTAHPHLYLAMQDMLDDFLIAGKHNDGGAKAYMELYEELSAHYPESY